MEILQVWPSVSYSGLGLCSVDRFASNMTEVCKSKGHDECNANSDSIQFYSGYFLKIEKGEV